MASKVKLTPYNLSLSATRLKKVLQLNRDLFCLRQLTLYRGAHGEGWGSVTASIDGCCQGGQFNLYGNILKSHPSMLGVGFVIREIEMMLWGAHDGYGPVKAFDLVEISKLASRRSGRKPYALYRCMFSVPRETCIIPQGDLLIR